MTWTQQERKAADAADLDQRVAALMQALRGGSDHAREAALTALTDFADDTVFPDLAARARAARAEGANTLIGEALAKRASVAGQLAPLGEVFAAAALIASSGKKELLFARLAASASAMLETMQALQAAAEKVRQAVGGVDRLGEVPAAIQTVTAALEALNAKIPRA